MFDVRCSSLTSDNAMTNKTATRILTPTSTFLQVEGDKSAGIVIDGGDLSKAAKPLALARGATEKAARIRT